MPDPVTIFYGFPHLAATIESWPANWPSPIVSAGQAWLQSPQPPEYQELFVELPILRAVRKGQRDFIARVWLSNPAIGLELSAFLWSIYLILIRFFT
ncbi:hypothetical protein [Endozoicomonas sp. YOMI1]|uniref:hypothetical protein n=1 Tax=Endozoicomonas sp. YOMI1 TaxID=2828739 RepID=UPI00214784E4|nr:hypothetical protein [Endozoicomonas sp. YOMI1]